MGGREKTLSAQGKEVVGQVKDGAKNVVGEVKAKAVEAKERVAR